LTVLMSSVLMSSVLMSTVLMLTVLIRIRTRPPHCGVHVWP
jgi:hypothetical protein